MKESLSGWMPFRLWFREGEPVVDWCRHDGQRFDEPFFEDSLTRLRRRPFNLLFRRPLPVESLIVHAREHPGIPPSGFIFHMSRCGSTLIAQMLGASRRNVVLSEAAPIDEVLRAAERSPIVSDEERVEWLRAMVSALGQKWHPENERLFIKFDCWSVLELPLIRRAFPSVPAIFVYRDPLEVLVSHVRQKGVQMVPQFTPSRMFGMPPDALTSFGSDVYCARVLAAILQAALMHCGTYEDCALLNYNELPGAVLSWLPGRFRMELEDAETQAMRNASLADAKRPFQEFREDAEEKRRAAPERLREVSERFLVPLYEELEARRTSRAASVSATRRSSSSVNGLGGV